MIDDPCHALVEPLFRPGTHGGPLAGLTYCVKDVFDLAGRVTGAGVPDWAATHGPADRDSRVVSRLAEAGADLVGVAKMTELSRGLTGYNRNYEQNPVNAAAPGHVTGGSSSGPAAAVRARTVDFAIASDTNGSVRVPASFCGVYGMRPSVGRVDRDGLMPYCPSFDTVGWLTSEPSVLRDVGAQILADYRKPLSSTPTLLLARDLFDLVDPALRQACRTALSRMAVTSAIDAEVEVLSVDAGALLAAQLVVQGRENLALHGSWFDQVDPRLSLGVARKVLRDALQTGEQERAAREVLQRFAATLLAQLEGGAVLLMPTTSTPAWRIGETEESQPDSFLATGTLVTLATCSGLPEVSMPVLDVAGLPMGLSLLGPPSSDELLLELAADAELWRTS